MRHREILWLFLLSMAGQRPVPGLKPPHFMRNNKQRVRAEHAPLNKADLQSAFKNLPALAGGGSEARKKPRGLPRGCSASSIFFMRLRKQGHCAYMRRAKLVKDRYCFKNTMDKPQRCDNASAKTLALSTLKMMKLSLSPSSRKKLEADTQYCCLRRDLRSSKSCIPKRRL